jgi:hypothetical protein
MIGIAKYLGKEEALDLYWKGIYLTIYLSISNSIYPIYWKGGDLENNGDVDGAIKFYKKAFRAW